MRPGKKRGKKGQRKKKREKPHRGGCERKKRNEAIQNNISPPEKKKEETRSCSAAIYRVPVREREKKGERRDVPRKKKGKDWRTARYVSS